MDSWWMMYASGDRACVVSLGWLYQGEEHGGVKGGPSGYNADVIPTP